MHFTSEKKAAYRASQRDCIIAAKQHRLFFMANIYTSVCKHFHRQRVLEIQWEYIDYFISTQ